MQIQRGIFLATALVLSACQTVPQVPENTSIPDIVIVPNTQVQGDDALARLASRQGILHQLEHWQLSGKLAVKGNERPAGAQMVWHQNGPTSTLVLSGPAGIGGLSLEIAPGVSTLRRSNGKEVKARTPEALIERAIGWPMPASLLRWWVVGVPDQGQVLSVDEQGRPLQFQYAEWTVSYDRYRDVDGLPLPGVVLITDGHLQLKLSKTRWKLKPVPDTRSRRVRIPGVDDE